MATVIEAIDVSKRFMLYHNRALSLKERFLGLFDRAHRQIPEEFWALKGISAVVQSGEALGIVGRNGSGKSTFLKLIAGIHRPTSGHLLVSRGAQIGTMIELGLGFHGELSGTENVFLNAAIHGLSRPQIEAIYEEVVEYSGLRHFMDVALKNYSSGMHMRLAFAIAAHLDPDVLLLDEIFAVGDEDFQRQCVRTMQDFGEQGKTIVFVSHTPAAVQAICKRVLVLNHGSLFHDGPTSSALDAYHRLLQTASTQPGLAADSLVPAWIGGDGLERTLSPSPTAEIDRPLADESRDPLDGFYVEFLRREGLQPHHLLLDVGNGLVANRIDLPNYLNAGRYIDVDGTQAIALAELGMRVGSVDFAVAPSLFRRLSLNHIARAVAAITRVLAPSGRFYATYFEPAGADGTQAARQAGGETTYADTEPYHYAFETLAYICSTVGADATRLGSVGHPAGEVMMLIRPASGGTAR